MRRRWTDGLVAPALAAVALLAITTVGVTWPVFRHPSTQVLDSPTLYGPASVLVQRDIFLTLWVLAWDTHALVTDPLRLFHANALYPAPYTLALSEHMLGNVPFFGPVYLMTGNPILAHQATLLVTFVLAGLGMAAYLHHWTHDRVAAIAGGMLFAFAPYRLWQLGNLHVISIHWMPLGLLGVDLALDGRRRAGAALLAASLVLSTMCSYYVGYAAFALAGTYTLVRVAARRATSLPALPALAAGFGTAIVLVAVMTVPYLVLQSQGGLPDRVGDDDMTSMAFLWLALSGPWKFTELFLLPLRDGIPEFLGYCVMALALVGIVVHRRAPRGALLAGAATGWLLGLGPQMTLPGIGRIDLPYRWLMAIVPGFSTMRVPFRFGALVTIAVTALAGLGLAEIRARLAARQLGWAGTALAAAVVLGALLEAHIPHLGTISVPVGESMPPAHRWLAEHGDGGAMIELPATGNDLLRQARVMYFSTAHWLPLANGYSPYAPPTYVAFMQAAVRLPDATALDEMLAVAPLRWVVVNRNGVDPRAWPAWQATFAHAGLRVAAEFPQSTVFEVPPERRHALPASPPGNAS